MSSGYADECFELMVKLKQKHLIEDLREIKRFAEDLIEDGAKE